jgi:hypothetical protein
MAEKGLTKRDLEQVFTGFEKRQDQKLKGLEERVDSKFKDLEERVDSKLNGLEERVDSKLKGLEERVINQFHIISEGLVDQIKLLAEGHSGIINRLNIVDERLDRIEKESERQHLETRALIKLSFAELDRRLTDLESQMKEMQDWKKQVDGRLHI